MTVREHVEHYLYDQGLWQREAQDVTARLTAADHPNNAFVHIQWDDDENVYPTSFYAALFLVARYEAIDYLTETYPQHFALRHLRAT